VGSGLVGFRRSFYGSTFVTGREGLEIVAGDSPEIVLVDFGLPDMEGYEVARQLHHKLGFRVRLAAVTGYGQPEIGKDLRRRASMVIGSRLSRSRMLRGFSWPSDARRVGLVLASVFTSPSAFGESARDPSRVVIALSRDGSASHSRASVVSVARPACPPLSGLIVNCKWVTPSPATDHCSCSWDVPGGLKLYS
jgi:CheY-like chemotaxis protein